MSGDGGGAPATDPARNAEARAEAAEAEARFRARLDEGEFLYCGHRWPRAPSAWRTHGARTKYHLCLYCGEPFLRRGKKEPPRFCDATCYREALRVRGAYREEMIREMSAEGAGDRDMARATGNTKNVVRQRCYEMGLGGPPRQRGR